MKRALKDKAWDQVAEKHAKHLAEMHIEGHNAEAIAHALKDLPTLKALEFLFEKAEKYRKENKAAKAALLVEAATLIDRKTGNETELVLSVEGEGKNEDTSLFIRQMTPREIFERPI